MRAIISRVIPVLVAVGSLTVAARGDEPRPAAAAQLHERPITAEDRAHWAFQPPRRPAIPVIRETGWVRNPIDAFVLTRVESEGLTHAPEADRATLLRRLSFDLIGLPPTPEEVAEFLADRRPFAYEARVERLLASPRFGERWAQHWLDLARYADSDGFEFDEIRPDAWRYRDWVVRALNHNLPFDRFVALQLAGDELEPDNTDAILATGFHRCYPDMVDLNDQGLRRQNALDDITETTGLVFLGLTIGCARCHDHKTDPVRQTDYYRLQSFFTPARFRDDYVIASPEQRDAYESRRAAWQAERARIQTRLIQIEAPARARLAPGPPPGLDDPTTAAFAKPEEERSPEEVRLVFEAWSKDKRVKPDAITAALDPDAAKERSDTLAEWNHWKTQTPPPPARARVLDEAGPLAPPTYLRHRGDYFTPGPEVQPAFPMVLAGEPPAITPRRQSTGRRAALTHWLTRPDHPLTARVAVNRLWEHHLGRGLVATPSDFGLLGEPPSHPELLDWLARELVERHWSLKELHRLIVTSATYRQSSRFSVACAQADPDNTLLWRHARRRLEGEAIRDAMLAVSGRLQSALGGPGIFPELPPELTKLSSKGAVWPISPSVTDRDRRSLYVFLRRNLRFPFFEAFDRPDTNASCPQRAVTTIAPQALSRLNGRDTTASARALAERVARESGPDHADRIERAYLLVLSRPPDPTEQPLALEFLRRGGDSALADLCLVLLNLNEFIYID